MRKRMWEAEGERNENRLSKRLQASVPRRISEMKTQKTATLFVDLNEVPMHEIDLLLHSIAFLPSSYAIFFSSLLFCVFEFIHTVSLHNFKARRALTTGYLFFFLTLTFAFFSIFLFDYLFFILKKELKSMLGSSRPFYTK